MNPNGADTQVWFVYSDSSSLAGAGQTTSQDIGSGTAPVQVSANLAGLDDSLNIYYRVVAKNSAGTTSGAINTFVTPPAPYFSIAPGAPVSVKAGATTGNTSTVTVAPWYWFTGTVSLACAVTPATGTDPPSCSLPPSVNITGSSSQTATITVMTTAASTTTASTSAGFNWPWSTGGLALACGLWRRKRRRVWPLMIAVIVLAVTGGCGGSTAPINNGPPADPGTKAGSYTITVTAVSGGSDTDDLDCPYRAMNGRGANILCKGRIQLSRWKSWNWAVGCVLCVCSDSVDGRVCNRRNVVDHAPNAFGANSQIVHRLNLRLLGQVLTQKLETGVSILVWLSII